MPEYTGVVSIDYTGARHVLGRTADSYAIWDAASGGPPLQVFPATPEGWTAAWLRFRELEGGFLPVAAGASAPDASIRPFGIGGVLAGTFQVWGRNFLAFFVVVGTVMIPFVLLQVLAFQLLLGPELEALFSGLIPRTEVEVYRQVIEDNLGIFIAAGLGMGLIGLFVQAFVTAALIRGGLQGFTGGKVRAGEVMGAAIRRTPSTAWILFLTGLLVALFAIPIVFVVVMVATATASPPLTAILLILAFLGIFLFASRYLLAPSALIAEDVRGVAALRRSWRLTEGRTWPVFGTWLLVLLMVAVATAVITLPFQIMVRAQGSLSGAWMMSALGNAVASSLMTPFATLAVVYIYIDSRARKEQLDPAGLDPSPRAVAP